MLHIISFIFITAFKKMSTLWKSWSDVFMKMLHQTSASFLKKFPWMCLLFDHNISLSAPALFSGLSFTLWIKSKFYKRPLISQSPCLQMYVHIFVLSISASPSHLTLTLAVQASCWFWYIATLESQWPDTRSFLHLESSPYTYHVPPPWWA